MERETAAILRTLGFRVRELRLKMGLTQEQAAEKLKMLAPNYARIEQGRANATVDTLVRVSKMLGVSLSELFGLPENRIARVGRPRRS